MPPTPFPRSVFDQAVADAIGDARRRTSMSDQALAASGARRPFPSPQDWRDINIYFLMADRFNNPALRPASERMPNSIAWDASFGARQGGTLPGLTARLPYIRDLGATAVWVSPIVKNLRAPSLMTYHGYAAHDLLAVDERWASDGTRTTAESELAGMVRRAHELGIYVILDIVLNHFGRVFWYDRGGSVVTEFADQGLLNQSEGGGAQPSILWTDGAGAAQPGLRDSLGPAQAPGADEAAYPVEFRDAGLFRRRGAKTTDSLAAYPWLGFVPGDFGDMRQLAVEYAAGAADPLRRYGANPALSLLLRSYQYLVAKYDFDAFRIDTVKYVHPKLVQRFGNAMTEFGVTVGKKNFFVFGEVADANANIAKFVGRNAGDEPGGGFGIDAALDFPLADKIKSVCTGPLESREPVSALRDVFDERRRAEDELISSHGDAANYFVTFVDNHDRHQRVRHPLSPDAEVRLCLGLLYALPGIPCLYYGTEQDLVGTRGANGPTLDSFESVREALWGKFAGGPWPETGGTYQMLKALIGQRDEHLPLRYGRYYFREASGDGRTFGWPAERGGVFAFSRVHADSEVLVVAYPNPFQDWAGQVRIDADMSPDGAPWRVAFSTLGRGGTTAAVSPPSGGRSLQVNLRSNELQIFTRA